MINILVIPSDNQGGVGFYRSTQPHEKLQEMYPDDFRVTFEMKPNWTDLESFKMFDIIHIHKGIFLGHDEEFLAAMKFFKENGIVTIMDIDDHWKLGIQHPQFHTQKHYGFDRLIQRNFKLFDYITTTTSIFAKEIKPFNKSIKIFPNAIDPTDPRFQVTKPSCDKLRIGMIMGSTHEEDMNIMNGFVSKLPKDILNKIEFVLCGFDTRGTMREYNKVTGEERTRPLRPEESVWYRYEKMMTNNYSIVSPEYRNFLEKFIPQCAYPNALQEGYKRCWTKDMNHYYQHYAEVDVLLAPLHTNDFNKVKSQLKVVECAFSNTAIVASDFGPYTLDLVNMIEKGGTINEMVMQLLLMRLKITKIGRKQLKDLLKTLIWLKNYKKIFIVIFVRNMTSAM